VLGYACDTINGSVMSMRLTLGLYDVLDVFVEIMETILAWGVISACDAIGVETCNGCETCDIGMTCDIGIDHETCGVCEVGIACETCRVCTCETWTTCDT